MKFRNANTGDVVDAGGELERRLSALANWARVEPTPSGPAPTTGGGPGRARKASPPRPAGAPPGAKGAR